MKYKKQYWPAFCKIMLDAGIFPCYVERKRVKRSPAGFVGNP